MKELWLHNRQRSRRLNLPIFRESAHEIMSGLLGWKEYRIHVSFLKAPDMEDLNMRFLQHTGLTDVITFDYRSGPETAMEGEICISVDKAIAHSAPFRATWQEEVFRYFVHGLLHLEGFDDRWDGERQTMKRRENQLMKKVRKSFPVLQIERQPR